MSLHAWAVVRLAPLILVVATGGCGDETVARSVDAAADLAPDGPALVDTASSPDSADTAAAPDTATAPDGASAILRLIDDFESGNLNGIGRETPLLYSWSASASNWRIEELQPARPGSRRGFHLGGGTFEDGADLFVDFHPVPRGPSFNHVDFSAFAGIAFWARAAAPDPLIYVALKDGNLFAQRYQFWEAELVHDDPWPSQAVRVTDRWQRYVLLFEDFRRGVNVDRGSHLDTSLINSIHFIAGTGGTPIDLWIDDLALLCRGPCPRL